jgi:hypothetical protein
MIQDLFDSNNAKVNATFDKLFGDLGMDKKTCERFVTAGGCLALVQLLKNFLNTAIARIPACDRVTNLNGLS